MTSEAFAAASSGEYLNLTGSVGDVVRVLDDPDGLAAGGLEDPAAIAGGGAVFLAMMGFGGDGGAEAIAAGVGLGAFTGVSIAI